MIMFCECIQIEILISQTLGKKQAECERSVISTCAKSSYGMKFYVDLVIMCSCGNFGWYFIILQWVITVLVTFARNEERNWNGWTPYLVGKVWNKRCGKDSKGMHTRISLSTDMNLPYSILAYWDRMKTPLRNSVVQSETRNISLTRRRNVWFIQNYTYARNLCKSFPVDRSREF